MCAGRFVRNSQREDLGSKSKEWLEGSNHVTVGKYDKQPLRDILVHDPAVSEALLRIQKTMGYG